MKGLWGRRMLHPSPPTLPLDFGKMTSLELYENIKAYRENQGALKQEKVRAMSIIKCVELVRNEIKRKASKNRYLLLFTWAN